MMKIVKCLVHWASCTAIALSHQGRTGRHGHSVVPSGPLVQGAELGASVYDAELGASVYGIELPAKSAPRQR